MKYIKMGCDFSVPIGFYLNKIHSVQLIIIYYLCCSVVFFVSVLYFIYLFCFFFDLFYFVVVVISYFILILFRGFLNLNFIILYTAQAIQHLINRRSSELLT